jgi:hypothetical protein
MKDLEFLQALREQVWKAIPKIKGGNETHVVTFITLPLWRKFCRAVGGTGKEKPTAWNVVDCWRVWGSETRLIKSKRKYTYSKSRL